MASRPSIVEIHLQIKAGAWAQTYNEVAQVLKKDPLAYHLVPLYITYDIEDTELRICFQVEEPSELEEFLVKEIRPIEGVYGTRARLTLNGEIFPAGVVALTEDNPSLRSSHVFLKVNPQRDAHVWEALRQLKAGDGVTPTWIFRDFYEYDRDITLRLVGKTDAAIRAYVEKQVSSIDGLLLWKLQFMHGMTQILAKDSLLALAQHWMSR